MKTEHRTIFDNSNRMAELPDESIDLVVTSPPYPMIEMWDSVFIRQEPEIQEAFERKDGDRAFESMHRILDPIWSEVFRVLKTGGIACINIGDATRTTDGRFCLYQNHTRLMSKLLSLGFHSLPPIIWRKPTNAPNKFMGSGMLPPGAYVTLEHEYILIVRKGNKRIFDSDSEKQRRKESAFFWEERNLWYSDVWMDLRGASQSLLDDSARSRSGAYPFELAYRLVNMFSVKEDIVLDPFFGTGTTMYAAMASGRNSIGIEIDENLRKSVGSRIDTVVPFANERIRSRIESHLSFIEEYIRKKGGFRYRNRHYQFPVVTRQEIDLLLNPLLSIRILDPKNFEASYSDTAPSDFSGDWENDDRLPEKTKSNALQKQPFQMKLLG